MSGNPNKFNFRTNRDIEEWLRSHDNMSKVIHDALDGYIASEEWRKSENVELKRLTDDFRCVGIEINLIAREVNTAEMSGRSPKGIDNIENLAGELQRLIQRANDLMEGWKTNPSDET